MLEILEPKDEDELAAVIAEAHGSSTPLEVCGATSKRSVGRPLQTGAAVSTAKLKGVTLYEPNELFISARAGTPLKDVESALAKNRQILAFEPVDLGPMLGEGEAKGTIGSVFATNLSGARRIQAGSARDHFIGMRAVNGQGEIFKSGGRVMKNVTGYDLCRGLAGSWGTLAVMSEVTMKVLPVAEATGTLLFVGLTDEVAVDAMCTALGTPFDVTGTTHLHADFARVMFDTDTLIKARSVTAIRLENFKPSLEYRSKRLTEALSAFGEPKWLDNNASKDFWADLRSLKFLCGNDEPVWRISTAPTNGPKLVAALSGRVDCKAAYDWSGGLIWLQTTKSADAGASEIRRVLAEIGGHATLIRAEPAIRNAVDVFHPVSPGVAELNRKLKYSFDPAGILNPGRMYAGL